MFERGLVTPARRDRCEKGHVSRRMAIESRGAKTLGAVGRVGCHSGANADERSSYSAIQRSSNAVVRRSVKSVRDTLRPRSAGGTPTMRRVCATNSRSRL